MPRLKEIINMNVQSNIKAEKKTLNIITISDILIYLYKHILVIILCVLFGLALGLVAQINLTGTDIKPTYSAMSSMLVTSKPSYIIEYGEPIYSDPSDLKTANSIIPTVTYLIKTDRVISLLTERLDQEYLDVDIDKIKDSIILENAENTPIIEVTLYWPDEAECILILNALMDVLPKAMLETINIGSVTVIDKAVEATPIYTPPVKYIIAGTVLGLLAGLGFAILAGILSPKVHNQSDIKNLLKLETLAELPLAGKKSGLLLSEENLPVEYGEACAIMASIFQYTTAKHGVKSIYVTSAVSGEGKTTVSVNLALALAQKKKRVVLIDMDIHRPMISGILGIPANVPTIQDVLNKTAPVADALFRLNDYLLVFRTGEEAPETNAEELGKLVAILSKHADYIIIDTPPVGLVSDALALNSCVDGVLFVIKQDYANMGLIADSINIIRDSGADLLGCIFNGTRRSISGKYYKKGYYYSKFYKKSGGYYRRGYYYRLSPDESAQNPDQEAEKADPFQINPEEIAKAVNASRSAQRKKVLHE
jgi:succinoglycan biosynthesis transport protein ExoP